MKKQILIMSAFMIGTFAACSQDKHEQHEKKEDAIVKTNADTKQTPTVNSKASASIREIVTKYIDLKNAFVNDNSNQAASAGKALESAFKNFDKKDLTPDQKKGYEDVQDDAREHAEHIGANGGNIEHQREHFVMLSKDIYDLIKALGSPQPLNKMFCPMANDGKGAFWLSEYKEVKNPYFGKKMMTCGTVKEEIK